MTKLYQLLLSSILFTLLFVRCTTPPCPDLVGRWTNREGKTFIFENGGRALWLVQFGSMTDTFPMLFRYDCSKKPAQLDFSDFKSGPLVGKTLFGILEWSSDSAFRFDAESGSSSEARPKEFNMEQTNIFYREEK